MADSKWKMPFTKEQLQRAVENQAPIARNVDGTYYWFTWSIVENDWVNTGVRASPIDGDGTVNSVNGVSPDLSGNVELDPSDIGASKISKSFTVTLLASGWANNQQTVTNSMFVADGYAYIVAPEEETFDEYVEAQIRAKNVTQDGQMTFSCVDVPSTNVKAVILREEAE